MTDRRYGAQSMSSNLREVLVKRPGPAFGRAFDEHAHGFLYPVDLAVAQEEHDTFVQTLASLGPNVHQLQTEIDDDPDLVYTYDALIVTNQGAIPLRPGVVIMAEGNPRTAAALADAGAEVHTYPATQIGVNGSGGPTCMTRPILRD